MGTKTCEGRKLKIMYDADGTLYDTLPIIFGVDGVIRKRFGYSEISLEVYKKHFQTKDWNKFYTNLGINNEDLEGVINAFIGEFGKAILPELIPEAKEILLETEKDLGTDNLYIITNEPKPRMQLRLERDGLTHLLSNTYNPFQGKAKEIFSLASQEPQASYVYIGDLVSDGEACAEARLMGAKNVLFYGILHKYAFNTQEAMQSFVDNNPTFASVLKNLGDIKKIWTPK